MRLAVFLFLVCTGTLLGQESFVYQPDSPHYLVVLPKKGWANMHDMVGGFAKYHASNYLEKELIVRQYLLKAEDEMPFVLVGVFDDETDAMLYFQRLKSPPVSFLQMGVATDYFIISAENYNQAIVDRSFYRYRNYFRTQYPE